MSKEKLRYVAQFFCRPKGPSEGLYKEKTHELPDGSVFVTGTERFKCLEVLFQLSRVGRQASGIHDMTFQPTLNMRHAYP